MLWLIHIPWPAFLLHLVFLVYLSSIYDIISRFSSILTPRSQNLIVHQRYIEIISLVVSLLYPTVVKLLYTISPQFCISVLMTLVIYRKIFWIIEKCINYALGIPHGPIARRNHGNQRLTAQSLKCSWRITIFIGFESMHDIFRPYHLYDADWFLLIATTVFWISFLLILMYLFHIVEKLHWLPWRIREYIFAVMWATCFFFVACVSATNEGLGLITGLLVSYGLLSVFILGYGTFREYRSWKAGQIARG